MRETSTVWAFILLGFALTRATWAQSGGLERPWRAQEALGAPQWLNFGLDHRVRFEHLEHDFRAMSASEATVLSLRTLVSASVHFAPVTVGAELQDSRAYATSQSSLNNTIVDPVELLQGYVKLEGESLLAAGDSAWLKAGRLTIDLGSRRLLARNDFRNTINAFTGIDAQWTSPARHSLRAFAVLPVLRLPADAAGFASNRIEFDRENINAIFWGLFYASAGQMADIKLEAYVLGLHEHDGANSASANRRLFTPGLRLFRAPAAGKFDGQAEVMLQLGISRASTAPTDTTDLSHRALSFHLSGGYQFDVPTAPRLAVQYDFASGDSDPSDGLHGRFDPLFGARRFDFGPTGIYGAFARSNLNSPALRVEVTPHRTLDIFAGYRLAWLASARDAWTTAGLRDASGASGTFVGQQWEARVRWNILPKNLALEVGAAYLLRGQFGTAPSESGPQSPLYVYTQLGGTI